MSSITEPFISREQWLLDPDVTFLNHGSFGPYRVMCSNTSGGCKSGWSATKFLTYELREALRTSADRLAGWSVETGDYVIRENATAGCNTVLNSIPLAQDDEILITNHCHPAVLLAA